MPFVWGPVGGAQNYPWRFITSAGLFGAASESIRNLLNTWQMRFSRRVGRAVRKASVFLTANTTNARELKRRGLSAPQLMLETGVEGSCQAPSRDFRHGGALRILWSGVFEHRKALHLLLQALAMLPPNVPYELRILGRGPLERRWRRLANKLNIERHCRWLGWLDHQEVRDQYCWADVFVFTSLRDTTGTVVLESLAAGTPVLTLNHQGVADVVTDDCGVRLPVTTPRDVACGLRDTLVRWYNNRAELESLSRGAFARADHYAWDRQGARMSAVYERVLDQATETFPTGSEPVARKCGRASGTSSCGTMPVGTFSRHRGGTEGMIECRHQRKLCRLVTRLRRTPRSHRRATANWRWALCQSSRPGSWAHRASWLRRLAESLRGGTMVRKGLVSLVDQG